MKIILAGHKFSGKSTIAAHFAQQYNYHFIDTDLLLLKNSSCNTIGELYKKLGEVQFREQEDAIIANLALQDNTIIAPGGGAFLNPLKLQEIGKIIYLHVPFATLYARLQKAPKLPQFLDPNNLVADFKQYYQLRDKIYRAAALYILDCHDKSILQIITEIQQNYGK